MAYNKEEWTLANPYGRLSWTFLALTILASMFFWIAAFHCSLTVAKTDEYKLFLGYWQREATDIAAAAGSNKDGNYCVAWDQNSKQNFFDGAWRFGKALGVMGTIVSGILFLMAFYILFYKIETRFFAGMLGASVYVGISSLLFLTSLASYICEIHDCRLGPGGYLAIVDFFLWMGVAFVANKLRVLSQEPEYAYNNDSSPPAAASSSNTTKYPQIADKPHSEETEENEGSSNRVTTLATYEQKDEAV